MKHRTGNRIIKSNRILLAGILLAIIFWLFEATIHVFVFHEGYFVGQLFTPELHETWMRLIVICLIIAFGYYTQSIISRRRRAYDLIRSQHNLALQLGTVVGLDEILRLCVEAAIKGSGMDAGGIYLVDEVSGDLNLVFSKGLSPDFVKVASHYDADSSSTRLIMGGQPIYVKYSKLNIPLDEIKRCEGLRVIAILPVHYKDKVIGSLNIASHSLDEIPVATRKMLETMAAQIGSYVARAQDEEALRESEERLSLALQGADLGTWDWNVQTGEVTFDKRWAEMLGYRLDEIEPHLRSWEKLVHPDELAAIEEVLDEHLKGKTPFYETEHRLQHKSGDWIWVLDIGRVIKRDENGKPLRACGTHLDITKRKQAEEARRESEKRCRKLFESAGDAIFMMDGEQFIDCNLKTLEMFGCTRDQIIGSPPYQYSPKQQADGRDSKEKAVKKINLALSGKPQFFEWLHCRHDGTPFPAEVSLNRIELSGKCFLQAIVRDITERKKAEKALKESENRYHELFNSILEGVGLVDTGEIIRFCNPAFAKIFEEDSVDNLIGKSILEYMPENQRELVLSQTEDRKKGRSNRYEVEIITGKSNKKTILISSSPRFDEAQNYIGAFGAIMDITETKQLQEFAERAKRMETAGQIAGQVAHDFNNLLGPLVAYPELIIEDIEENHPVIKYIKSMETAARQMADINQQLLTLGRRGHYNLEPLNLNKIVNQVLNQILPIPETLIIETSLSEDLMNINGGVSQIFRVIANLTSNAIDAMQGIGRLTIKTENWYTDKMSGKYGQVPKGEYVKLTLIDTGCGIQEENLHKVFEPFFSTKKAGKKRGSGLGLSVVHAVIKDHDGFIDLESVIGQGTSAYLYFPITRDAIVVDEIESITGGSETVLVVDDDSVQREVTLKLLQKLGYKADTVECGEAAIEYLKKQPCDLLVLDMIIPDGIDGTETYKKTLEINPEQKAIIISGYSESERVVEARRLGVGAFLKKPLTLETIGRAVRKELDRKQQFVIEASEA